MKDNMPLYIKKNELKTFRSTTYGCAVIAIEGIEYITNNDFDELVDILIKRNEKSLELKICDDYKKITNDLLASWNRLPIEVLPLRSMDEIGVRKQGDTD